MNISIDPLVCFSSIPWNLFKCSMLAFHLHWKTNCSKYQTIFKNQQVCFTQPCSLPGNVGFEPNYWFATDPPRTTWYHMSDVEQWSQLSTHNVLPTNKTVKFCVGYARFCETDCSRTSGTSVNNIMILDVECHHCILQESPPRKLGKVTRPPVLCGTGQTDFITAEWDSCQ